MRAVGFNEFGGPEVLRIVELPVPEPGNGEVRIRVAAATVNPTDTALRSGGHAERMGQARPPYVPGMELAGTVDAAGENAGWAPGERVLAIVAPMAGRGGAQAEFVVVPADSVARVPEGIGLVAAATLPMNGLTARRALDLLALEPGETLAVTGAAGAVGGYVTELACAEGLRVIADAKPEDEPLVRGFGADVVVPRGPDVATAIRREVPGGVAALVDTALLGGRVLPAVRDGGQLATVRPFDGEPERGIEVTLVLVGDYLHASDQLERLTEQVTEGRLTLRVAATLPAERAVEAHRRLGAGGVRGRLVLTF
ncbi:NADP-dependent oxidoreductase [Qaidamihabitans albus]|uniref:NADP-dependent oxidoreductase n=1 Tax=Qaidamihabitans albus TaxID=2795733 RepID=UPI0018F1248F|nr:NADP-dependent oxidoreductase [Qaidamihabitans albus]